ncbi:MAG: SDR family oxidoreductase [Bacteroidales bacterium]|nr:SDR family oxidoreductase [Bacteroidales bacterium]
MKILLTGSTGYIGKRLLSVLVNAGHKVICCVRDESRFNPPEYLKQNISVLELDLLDKDSLGKIPSDIDGAYYLVHSMTSTNDYRTLEEQSASNFRDALNKTDVRHVIYLGGIVNESNLSKHLESRKNVESILSQGNYHFTALRAGIIIGSGSASFEIIRDLVEKLPVMIAPKWLKTRCQPIGVSDVLAFLSKSLFNPETFDQTFDIGGPDILTYKDMLMGFAKVRNLKRSILTVPVMSPNLSSYWLYFVTSTSYRLARNLVDSMGVEVICRDNRINQILEIFPLSYEEAIQKAFRRIETHEIESSWKDANISSGFNFKISAFVQVPEYGCFKDRRIMKFNDREKCIEKIWGIGGENGWYYGNWLWEFRGFLDKLAGGVGLRRGRTNPNSIHTGDTLDFWRVLYANRQEGRLLLFAEMKLPGEAWLEFRIHENTLIHTATFRPLGLAGRLYWYSVFPFHGIIFDGMIKKLTA